MKTLEILINDTTSTGKNISLKFNDKDVGVLYLNNDEYYDFIKILRKGTDLEVELIEPLDDFDIDEE